MYVKSSNKEIRAIDHLDTNYNISKKSGYKDKKEKSPSDIRVGLELI